MLLEGVDRMGTCVGVSYADLENHVRDYPSYDGFQHPLHRLAWEGDPWPFVTMEGRRAQCRMKCEVEFGGSL
eukprot:6811478-Pyramimonas_sp.AAC.1